MSAVKKFIGAFTRSKRRVIGVAAMSALLSWVSFPSHATDPPALSQRTIRLAVQPDPALAPIVYAVQKGWFKEAGFDKVEVRQFTAGVEAGQALVGGNIDVWQPASVPAISLINRGAPVRIVGQGSKCRLESLLVRPDAGVKNPEDLYKTSIAVLQGSTLNAYLANLAKHYGLDYAKLKIVNMAPAESLAALISGGIGAAVTFPPTTGRAIQDARAIEVAGRVSGFQKDKGAKTEFSQTRCVLVMNEAFISKHPDSAEAVMSTISRAQKYISQPANVEEAQEVFAAWSGQKLADVKGAWSLYQFPTQLDSDFRKDLEDYSRFLQETGAIKGKALPVDKLIDLRIMNAALAKERR